MKYSLPLVLFLLMAPTLLFGERKKLYISEIRTIGDVDSSLAERIRSGIKLKIFETHGSEYHIVSDEDITLMYRQAAELRRSGCTAESCVKQIGDAIQADEIIHGEVRSGGKNRIILSVTNLVRNPVSLKIGTKSTDRKEFELQYLDFYAGEFGTKMMNPRYRIQDADFQPALSIHPDSISLPARNGEELPVFTVTPADASLRLIVNVLADRMREGDTYYREKKYEKAKEVYGEAITGIWDNIGSDTIQRIRGIVMEFHQRYALSLKQVYYDRIAARDKSLPERSQHQSELDDLVEDYEEILHSLQKEPEKDPYKKASLRSTPLNLNATASIRSAQEEVEEVLKNRLGQIIRLQLEIGESEADEVYKKYRFKEAIAAYSGLLDRAASSSYESYGLAPMKARLITKKNQARITAAALENNEIISLLDQTQYYGIINEIVERNAIMSSLRERMTDNDLVSEDVTRRYRELALLWSLETTEHSRVVSSEERKNRRLNDLTVDIFLPGYYAIKHGPAGLGWTLMGANMLGAGLAISGYRDYHKYNKLYKSTDEEAVNLTVFLKSQGHLNQPEDLFYTLYYMDRMAQYRNRVIAASDSYPVGGALILVAYWLGWSLIGSYDKNPESSAAYHATPVLELETGGYANGVPDQKITAGYKIRY